LRDDGLKEWVWKMLESEEVRENRDVYSTQQWLDERGMCMI